MVSEMRHLVVGLGTVAVVAASAVLLACNGLLGIGVASQEAEDAGSQEAAAPEFSCANYCNLMVQNCNWSTEWGEYITADVCNKMCIFDMGNQIGPTDDDTLGCRIYYAKQAAHDPATNCRFAGLLGGNKCGTSACQDFCTADVPYCQRAGSQTYPSIQECEDDCTTLDGGYPYLKEDGGELFQIEHGNTLNCRTWHLNNAYVSTDQTGALLHCPHTQLMSVPCR